MKKMIALLLALSMLLCLVACGEADPNLGKYYIYTSTFVDYDGTEEAAEPDGEWVELKKGGEAIYYAGFEFSMTWKLEGEDFHGEISFLGMEEGMEGTLKDGILTVMYCDYRMVFVKEGVTPPPTEAPTETTTEAAAPLYTGYYPIYSMNVSGTEFNYADMVNYSLAEGTYLQINDDFTGELGMAGEDPESFTLDEENGIIIDSNGDLADISFDGDFITVSIEEDDTSVVLVFASEDVERPTEGNMGSITETDGTDVTSLENPSEWYGLVAVTGSDARLLDAYGYIDTETSTGKTFFEIYTEENESTPLVSMYCELDNGDGYSAIIPVIGEEDAWVGESYLTAGQEGAYSVYLVNGALYMNAQDGDILYAAILRPYGDTWEGETTVPPGLDDYLASLS